MEIIDGLGSYLHLVLNSRLLSLDRIKKAIKILNDYFQDDFVATHSVDTPIDAKYLCFQLTCKRLSIYSQLPIIPEVDDYYKMELKERLTKKTDRVYFIPRRFLFPISAKEVYKEIII
jgi:hypothetical protein